MTATLTINGQTIAAQRGLSLFDHAESLGIEVPTSCRKQGKCRECMLEIVEGLAALTPCTDPERHLRGNFRLACQTYVAPDSPAASIRCHTMRRGTMRIERRALNLPVSKHLDPAVTRDGDRILLDGVEIDRSPGPIHGLAMDLGTTTVVLRLLDLETGEFVADTSLENPQRFAGSEVMSRIAYDSDHPGRLLLRTLAGYLTHAIEKFPVDPRTIYEMVVVGNSTMRDLFFRQSVHPIGQSPYRSITEIDFAEGRRTTTALTQSGLRSLLPSQPRARVYGAPIISGHVGADAAAAMLAVDLAHEDRLVAIMDIGTNTELILGNKDRILAASCPAGPAFEGGAIACGMPALDGAIEEVCIDDSTGAFHCGTIGDVEPQGICGSGLIDVLSELLRTGRMNDLGRFDDGPHRIVLHQGPAPAEDIYLLESDVNELAQAKGANVAGLHTVFSTWGIDFDDIDLFYLAGGFGRHLNVAAAQRIGLIPPLPPAKVVQAGNTAIEGATIALLSSRKRAELESLVRRVEHCRLETHASFFDFFVEGCQFKPLHSNFREAVPCPR
ncbi:MAG TPA: ASKHA domain-containing protein [Acidobacteriaceae bacterium]